MPVAPVIPGQPVRLGDFVSKLIVPFFCGVGVQSLTCASCKTWLPGSNSSRIIKLQSSSTIQLVLSRIYSIDQRRRNFGIWFFAYCDHNESAYDEYGAYDVINLKKEPKHGLSKTWLKKHYG